VKNVETERDSFAGRLLVEALEAHAPAMPEGPCLDAETLAAWADETLTAPDRLRVEVHAAGCARCQALLAVMMKTASPPDARRSAWRVPVLGWLIPVAAAAAAVLVWALIPGRATLPSSGRSLTVADQDATADRSTAAEELSPPAIVGGAAGVERSRVAAGPPASPIPATIGGAYASPVAVGTVIVSPSPDSRWRIVPGGTIERSTDRGLNWQVQETGATVTLAGGASPSPSVCWLVGPAGTVLLSTDGLRWQRLRFPETMDLMSVRAADDKVASVIASDGRTFSTRDRGLTWHRNP
jgi:hypothetical protein